MVDYCFWGGKYANIKQIYDSNSYFCCDFLAGSINVNPVIIRNVLQQLKAAGLVTVKRGSGGASIVKPLNEITFLDVFNAVESIENGELFHFHDNPNPNCPVGRNIHKSLDDKLNLIQEAMEKQMQQITIEDVVKDTQKYINTEHV